MDILSSLRLLVEDVVAVRATFDEADPPSLSEIPAGPTAGQTFSISSGVSLLFLSAVGLTSYIAVFKQARSFARGRPEQLHVDNPEYGSMLEVVAITPQISKFGSSCLHRLPIDL